MRGLVTLILLFTVAFVPQTASSATANTIDELAAMYNIEACVDCHEDIHDEWKTSWHAKSMVDSRVVRSFRTYILSGLDKTDQGSRKDMKYICFPCHAPQTKDASDELVVEIAGLIVTAADDKDKGKREAAKKELAKININCHGCHSLKGAPDGKPKPGEIYGPNGLDDEDSPHMEELGLKSIKSDIMKTSKVCAECHHGCPPDMPSSICPTIYTSYEEEYIAHGGDKTCQDCHMREDGEVSHKFPGIYETEFAGTGIELTINAKTTEFVYYLENRIVPAVVVEVGAKNTSGHGLPHG